MNELAVSEQQQHLQIREEQQPINILGVIAAAANDPRVDVSKMQALLDMERSIRRDQAEIAFNEALTRIQTNIPRIEMRGETKLKNGGVMNRYAKYEDIDKAVRPLLAAEGLVFTFLPGISDKPKHTRVTAVLRHTKGHSIEASIDLPQDDSGAKNELQGRGSAMAYAKRYLITQMLNIVTEGQDNDGNAEKPVSEKDQMMLEDLLQESGVDREKFLKHFGISKLAEMPLGKLQGACLLLNQRIADRKAAAPNA